MALSRDQIQEIVQRRPSKKIIDKAVAHESRLKFHSESVLTKSDLARPAYTDFLRWVGGTDGTSPILLPADKFRRFKQLLTTPIATVDLTESIYTKIYRIFKGEDAHSEYDGDGEKVKEFFEQYDLHNYWATKGFAAMRSSINSVWVADLPADIEEDQEYPDAYGYLIPISQVIDIQNDADNNCLFLVFKASDYVVIYDPISISKWEYKDGTVGQEVVSFDHGLGYTPAKQMWSEKIEGTDLINKKSPVSNVLSWLDYYLFMLTNQRYMELGNSYPITALYTQEGGLDNIEGKGDNLEPEIKAPKGSELIGPGFIIGVPPPMRNDEPDLMANPVQIISPDVTGLEYHVDRMLALREAIFIAVAGQDDDLQNNQAKNELQVASSFESRVDVLSRIKKNFEIIEKFSVETLYALRYNEPMVASIDYGTKFFLRSLSQLEDDYNKANESGADPVVLESIKQSILSFKYQNNPSGMKRAEIVNSITPYRDRTIEDLIKLHDKDMLDERMFLLRMNILDFVSRFERENAPITVFGSEMDYNNRVDAIRAEIDTYIDEILTKRQNDGTN